MGNRSIWIGFDPREAEAFAVARHSARVKMIAPVPILGLVLSNLRELGLYTRETQRVDNRLFDVISGAPMSTEFAISRFLVPHLAKKLYSSFKGNAGWALFMDSDVLCRRSLEPLFRQADKKYAVLVVKHNFNPPAGIKMDGQAQTQYARKNWSSVMLFNCDHPANAALTPELVNAIPGRDLHRFCWLDDSEIGEIDASWNFLVGHHDRNVVDPSIVHFTDGIPTMSGYADCDFADEWNEQLKEWALRG